MEGKEVKIDRGLWGAVDTDGLVQWLGREMASVVVVYV